MGDVTVHSASENDSHLLSAVIPCFNEEAVLPLLKERLSAAAQQFFCKFRPAAGQDPPFLGSRGPDSVDL